MKAMDLAHAVHKRLSYSLHYVDESVAYGSVKVHRTHPSINVVALVFVWYILSEVVLYLESYLVVQCRLDEYLVCEFHIVLFNG